MAKDTSEELKHYIAVVQLHDQLAWNNITQILSSISVVACALASYWLISQPEINDVLWIQGCAVLLLIGGLISLSVAMQCNLNKQDIAGQIASLKNED